MAKKLEHLAAGDVGIPVRRIAEDYAVTRIKSLAGRILTIVDAMIADKQQNAAFKSLVKKEFRAEISTITYNPECNESSVHPDECTSYLD